MKWQVWLIGLAAVITGTIAVRAQFLGAPGGFTTSTYVQFNTNGLFGGITGLTSDGVNVGFATSNQPILYGQTPGNCLSVDSNFRIISQSCSAGSQTSIVAGSNITTSGSSGNVTINVVATPSFTTVIASGNITAGTAQFTGQLTGTSAVFQTATVSNLTPTGPNCLQETGGVLQATNTGCATQTATPSIAAGTNITTSGTAANTTVNVVATPSFTTVIASGNITAGTAQFTGQVTGTSAVFQTVTVNNLTPTGPNCLQETGGVLQATNAACATPTSVSIAAGTNITTSGTASNITVNVVATPSFTTVIATGNLTGSTAQFSGLLTGTNAQFQTLTVTNLTPGGPNCLQETGGVLQATNSACASGTLTSIAQGNNIVTSGTASNITVTATPTGASNTVQFNNAGVFGGDGGFQYAGGTSGIVTHTLGTITTTNSKALSLVGNWSNSTTTFAAPLFVNIITNTTGLNTTNGFGAGSKLTDIQASSASIFSVFPNGSTVNGSLTGTTVQAIGWLTGPGANLQTATIAGALIGSTGNFSSNLTAGTVLGVVGWLTAPGVNMQTATLAGALIGASGNFSTNLTGNIAQFAGFMSAGGASLSGLTIQTATFSSNLTGTTANFSSNLTANIAQFAGFLSAGGASLSGVSLQTATFSQITGTSAFVTSVIGNAGTNSEGSISFLTNNVVQIGDGGSNANGYYNWGGEARLSADSAGLITTGFGNLLTVNVKAGRTYKFDAELPLKSATASTGGIGLRVGGGATATNIVYDGWVVDSGFNGTKGNTQATALSTTVASTSITGTTSHATLIGTITVNAAGTIILQASGFSTVTAASAVTVARGATFIVEDMP